MNRRKLTRILATTLAIVWASAALAQEGPGGPPPPDQGPGGGQGEFRRPPMPRGPIGLLMNPKVQQELKLTDDQIEKIRSLRPERGGGPGFGGPGGEGPGGPPPPSDRGGPGFGGPGGGPGYGGPGGPGGPGGRQMEQKIKAILTASQYQRFHEIDLQAQGARAIGRPEVAKELGLSEDQIEQIHDMMPPPPGGPGGFGPGRGGPGQGGPGGFGPGQGGPGGEAGGPPPPGEGPGGFGGPPGMGPQGGPRVSDEKILSVLTAGQRAKWKEMQGAKFDFGRRP